MADSSHHTSIQVILLILLRGCPHQLGRWYHTPAAAFPKAAVCSTRSVALNLDTLPR